MSEATSVPIEEQYEDAEIYAFQAEISWLMHLIKDTFKYSKNKEEIVLCELISNASRALDKIRCESFTDPNKLGNSKDLCIKIIPNKDDGTLTIIDNGIGMTKADLIKNPGSIAKSGTKAFMDVLMESIRTMHQIKPFEYLSNIGFYSAYLVADKVTVTSKHNDDIQYIWESSADDTFIVRPDHGEPLGRGTKIVLYLNSERKILNEMAIKHIIRKHNHLIGYSIKLVVQKVREREVTDDEAEEEEETGNDEKGWISSGSRLKSGVSRLFKTESPLDETKVENIGEEDKMKKKKIMEKFPEYEELNNTKRLWMRNPEDISQLEYDQFYKSLTNDSTGHLAVKHYSVEGQMKFRALLFVPKQNSSNLLNYSRNGKNSIKLYIRGIFVMDSEDLQTDYLNFIQGVVESEDLPLNISKKMLLQNKVLVENIRKSLEEKCLELFDELAKDKNIYKQFYKQFRYYLKEKTSKDSTSSKKLAKFLRFFTSLSGDEHCSLQDYVSRMKENQKSIYFIIGENKDQVANSPIVERVTKLGFEVIYMTDYYGQRLVEHLKEYDGKTLVSVVKINLELPDDDEIKKKFEEDKMKFETLCKVMKDILGKKVEKVVISNRLESSPCCIIINTYDDSPELEKMIKRMTKRLMNKADEDHLEINPYHPVIENLRKKVDLGKIDKSVEELVILLFETSLPCSGVDVENPHIFASRVYRAIELSLGIHEEKAGA